MERSGTQGNTIYCNFAADVKRLRQSGGPWSVGEGFLMDA